MRVNPKITRPVKRPQRRLETSGEGPPVNAPPSGCAAGDLFDALVQEPGRKPSPKARTPQKCPPFTHGVIDLEKSRVIVSGHAAKRAGPFTQKTLRVFWSEASSQESCPHEPPAAASPRVKRAGLSRGKIRKALSLRKSLPSESVPGKPRFTLILSPPPGRGERAWGEGGATSRVGGSRPPSPSRPPSRRNAVCVAPFGVRASPMRQGPPPSSP